MKIILSIFFWILFFATPAHAQWQNLASKLDYQQFNLSETKQIHVLRMDLRTWRIDPIVTPAGSAQTVANMAAESKAIAVINANFFGQNYEPLGLIQKRFKTLNPVRPISWWGILGVKNQKAFLTNHQNFKIDSGLEAAVQAGPRLLMNGQIPKLKANYSAKTAIGFNSKNSSEVYWIVSPTPIEINDFARWIKYGSHLGIDYALNLDGGSSTQMAIRAPKKQLDLAGFARVPVGLGLFRR